ncbi:MAG: flagellar biosynthesis anti-sigma factor FlgM [Actinomycetota bacterium]|nr:flagellar biosynthesis anti-sigma factor FlgM [Actinomycetota bacterium]
MTGRAEAILADLRCMCVKSVGFWADTQARMIISDEQVRRAVEYLQTSEAEWPEAMNAGCPPSCPPELIERVKQRMTAEPDVREDRIESARVSLAKGLLSSGEVASKMIGRIVSDSLR